MTCAHGNRTVGHRVLLLMYQRDVQAACRQLRQLRARREVTSGVLSDKGDLGHSLQHTGTALLTGSFQKVALSHAGRPPRAVQLGWAAAESNLLTKGSVHRCACLEE